MPASVSIGTMTANLDKKTGAIRLTSKEKGSPLKAGGFMVHITPGSKEYSMLNDLINEASEAETTWIQRVLAADDIESRTDLLMDMWVWENHDGGPKFKKSVKSAAEKVLADIDSYYPENKLWIEAMSVEHALKMTTEPFRNMDDNWINRMPNKGTLNKVYYSEEYMTLVFGAEQILGFMMEEIQRSLPAKAEVSREYASDDITTIPLGLNFEIQTFSWKPRENASIISIGSPDSQEGGIVPLVILHVAKYRHAFRALMLTDDYDGDVADIPMARETIREISSLEEVCEMVGERLDYVGENSYNQLYELIHNGDIKETFVVLSSRQTTRLIKRAGRENIERLMSEGPKVGVHVVLAVSESAAESLPSYVADNIDMRISFSSEDPYPNLCGRHAIVEKPSLYGSLLSRIISVFSVAQ